MTLTVRLKPEIESALELHCAERGVTKSLVVQEMLAEYLVKQPGRARWRAPAPEAPAEPSETYRAFEALGLIGAVFGVGPADKAGVHAAFDRWAEAKRRSRVAVAPSSGPEMARRAPAKRLAR